eukprot:scaffold36471_cov36-Phaeocystis_antarctica.AAC.1
MILYYHPRHPHARTRRTHKCVRIPAPRKRGGRPSRCATSAARARALRNARQQRGWPAPTRHTRSTVTEGLGCALARLTQP